MHAEGLSPTPPRTHAAAPAEKAPRAIPVGGPPMLLGARQGDPPLADAGSGLRIGAVAGGGI